MLIIDKILTSKIMRAGIAVDFGLCLQPSDEDKSQRNPFGFRLGTIGLRRLLAQVSQKEWRRRDVSLFFIATFMTLSWRCPNRSLQYPKTIRNFEIVGGNYPKTIRNLGFLQILACHYGLSGFVIATFMTLSWRFSNRSQAFSTPTISWPIVRHRPMLDMQIRSADTAECHPHNSILRMLDCGFGFLREIENSYFNVCQCLHKIVMDLL